MMMGTLWQDIRYGFRTLLKRPGFALVAVFTLSLGIGANTAIFSVVNGVLLRQVPYKDPESIVTVWQNNVRGGIKRDDVAPANFLDWREQNRSFEEMSVIEPYSHSLTGEGEPESFKSWLVSDGFFKILGAHPLFGRTFLPEEHQPGRGQVVVLSYGLWQRRFGADQNLMGQQLNLNGRPHTVVGVMPPEFQFPAEREIWAPRPPRPSDQQNRGSTYLNVIARLKTGVTLAQAQEDMNAIAARLSHHYPQTNMDVGVTIVPLPEQLTGHIRPTLIVLLAAVGLVLLIACANVANLLLVRGAERQREFAVRAALGAGRLRLVRQLFTESIVLATLGGLCGLLLAYWGSDLILAFSPGSLLSHDRISVDSRVLGFALGISGLTALIFGLIPSLQFSKPDLNEALKEGGRTVSGSFARHRLRNFLVVSEIALALMLLIGAGLLVRSFVRLLQVNPGFATESIAALEVHVWGKYRTPEGRRNFFNETLERISALPGVEAAGAVSSLPFIVMDSSTPFTIEGSPAPAPGKEPSAYWLAATPDYFRAMNIPLRQGRFFNSFDKEDATPVILVNETMARRYWPGSTAVGKKITTPGDDQKPLTLEVVGVVGDVRHKGLDSEPRPEFFTPHRQDPTGSMIFVVRTASDPQSLLPAIKSQIWAVNKDIAFDRAVTIKQLLAKSLEERRFALLLVGSFALIALLLAGVGIYGMISFTTGQRTHEIGVRMALGAQTRDILKMILRQGLILTLSGVCLGLTGAVILTRFLQSMLFGVSATDPVTFVVISLLLTAVALLASYIPARRAMKVDPMVALRYE
jgi:putative ABC transport system permease protein